MAEQDKSKGVRGVTRPAWAAPVLVVLVLVALGAGFYGYQALSSPLPDATSGWGGIGTALAAALLAVAASVLTRRRIEVDRQGISLQVGIGKSVRIRWSEPHDYYYLAVTGSSTPSVQKASVRTADGRRIDVDGAVLADFPNANVPALVERYSTDAKLPDIEKRLEAGQQVDFGALRLGAGRLHVEDQEHSIEDGVVLNIERGCVQVGVGGKWSPTQVNVRQVANYPCLLRVIGQLTRARAPL